jgi:hypothetical protein
VDAATMWGNPEASAIFSSSQVETRPRMSTSDFERLTPLAEALCELARTNIASWNARDLLQLKLKPLGVVSGTAVVHALCAHLFGG